tara:strand:- start:1233 stop:1913 length:681 start_codon:yes stop_codon:yes gene_type:complete
MTIKLTGSNSGSVSLEAPATASGDISLTLPNSTGTAGQVLATDGTGNLSFAAGGGLKAKQYRLQYFVGNTTGGVGPGAYYSVGSGNNGSISTYESWKDITVGGSGSSLNMSIDSGYKFEFPETGLYLILMKWMWYIENGQSCSGLIGTTTDNYATTIQRGSYSVTENEGSDYTFMPASDNCLFNVTNTSTHKVSVVIYSVGANSQLKGDYNNPFTSITFLRLGDSV